MPHHLQDDLRWRPSATREALASRAEILARIRAYFSRHNVMEVDTPVMSRAATTDPAIHSLATTWHGPGSRDGERFYLHTSPEFPMKRLLAAGSGDIYQLCKVFRDYERGALHSPEFTLLEWYRNGFDHLALMDDVERLLTDVLPDNAQPVAVTHWSYRDLFREYTGLDPLAASSEDVAAVLAGNQLDVPVGMDGLPLYAWLDLLMTALIEPRMGRGLLFVTDFPASQASLARLRADNPQVAARFEVWLDGIEIANGFHELADSAEQRQRFMRDNERRRRAGLEPVPMDEHLLAALQAGLPDCAGVAVGVDRLLMLASGAKSLDAVQSFPVEIA